MSQLSSIIGRDRHKYNVCRDKHNFVATKDVFRRDKSTLVATNIILFCRDKTFVVTNSIIFVATKMILVAAPASESPHHW